LVELRLVGVYLDRADVYSDVGKACPDAARRMVAFAKRLAVHARGHNPDIFVLLQNAKVLFGHRDMIEAIETIAKEDLFYGINHDEVPNPPGMVRIAYQHGICRALGPESFRGGVSFECRSKRPRRRENLRFGLSAADHRAWPWDLRPHTAKRTREPVSGTFADTEAASKRCTRTPRLAKTACLTVAGSSNSLLRMPASNAVGTPPLPPRAKLALER
jgi:hypothetical protein